MLKEVVEVLRADQDKVEIKFKRQAACACCRASGLCGVDNRQSVSVDNIGLQLACGDRVEVGIRAARALEAAVITFVWPSLIFIGLLWFARRTGQLASFLLAMAGIFVYYLTVKRLLHSREQHFSLKLLRKL